jgi:hypothetical protein
MSRSWFTVFFIKKTPCIFEWVIIMGRKDESRTKVPHFKVLQEARSKQVLQFPSVPFFLSKILDPRQTKWLLLPNKHSVWLCLVMIPGEGRNTQGMKCRPPLATASLVSHAWAWLKQLFWMVHLACRGTRGVIRKRCRPSLWVTWFQDFRDGKERRVRTASFLQMYGLLSHCHEACNRRILIHGLFFS